MHRLVSLIEFSKAQIELKNTWHGHIFFLNRCYFEGLKCQYIFF